MHGQLSTLPNIHHCVLDLMHIFTALLPLTESDMDGENLDLMNWTRFLLLGLCHKTLRALDLPHFAACFLNPGVGRIPDLNEFLPWDRQWFSGGIEKEKSCRESSETRE